MRKNAKTDGKAPAMAELSMNPDAREAQIIAAAEYRAYQQILDGTASSQVITHYLKLGSSRNKLETEIMEKQKELISAKTEVYQSSKEMDKVYRDAIKAMGIYSGAEDD